ncbi:ImmA/IrrE family metallo-endopeptidase [Limosilactobacillus ingluviei]|uniref:ImmA/IrrE family metallo-endopeptidase n=1 Tax=Limosilactobacillus ingluviei TaxID=148604 RepID=UPI0023F27E07|nr:ImmA/IrrE family metallo-endopeptidase [Limosilactobacillus ingluviei]
MKQEVWIKHKVHQVAAKFGTSDPFKICDKSGIQLRYDDLGSLVLGYHAVVKRIPTIVLSTRNTDLENRFVCAHELGHHFCHHSANAEWMTRAQLSKLAIGDEYQANVFMSCLFVEGIDLSNALTKQEVLYSSSLPAWAERYVPWDLIK